jgi:hypothetical protein
MKNIAVSLFVSLAAVACSGSPSAKIEPVTMMPTQMADASDDLGQAPPSMVDSGSPVVEASVPVVDATTPVVDAALPPPAVDSGHDVGHDAGKVVVEDAGHDAALPPPVPCTLPVTAVTYTYVFTNVTVNCDNTLASYPVGPLNPGAFNLATLVPGFCATAAGVSTVTGLTESADGCAVSATTTCSDPVPATLPDGGADPLTDVSVVKLTSNTGGTVLDGTLALTTTDEVTKATCTQTYTFVATAK